MINFVQIIKIGTISSLILFLPVCLVVVKNRSQFYFKYSPEWLNRHASIILSEDIRNYPGVQYTQPGT